MSSTSYALTHTTSLRAAYRGGDGKIRKSHLSHINDDAKPLCRVRARGGLTDGGCLGWTIHFEPPTCPVCLRFAARIKGGAV